MATIISSSVMTGEKKWLKRTPHLHGGKGSSFMNCPVRREFREEKETRVTLTAWSNWSKMPESFPDSRKAHLETPTHGKTGVIFLQPLKHVFKITSM